MFVEASNEFVTMAQTYGRRWQRLLQHEHRQRVQLQEQMEQLARQHSLLENAATKERTTEQEPIGEKRTRKK